MHLILSPRVTEDSIALAEAAVARGWTVDRLAGWRVAPGFVPPAASAIYGEALFARVVAAQCGLVLLEPPHDWLARLPECFLRRRVAAVRFADLPSLTYPAFVKPPDDKLFPARVYQSVDDLLDYQNRQSIPGDALALVSDPVHFHKEFRVHVLRGEAVSVSRYCVDGELAVDAADEHCAAAVAFAAAVAREAMALTPPAVVIDVGILETGEWAVIEANPAFGSGIYAGDANRILEVVRATCLPADEPGAELRQYLFPVLLG